MNLTEGASTGDIATCTPGTWAEPGPSNSLRLVNLYRFVAAMPAVTEDPSYDSFAQDCAVLQAANSASGLTHTPDASVPCYSASAATGSAHSSICGGQGVECIDLYMQDGDSPEMGHRRWIFANYLGPVGFGSVGTGYPSATGSCFYQPAGTSNANMPFVAWPPPGEVPVQAITTTDADTAGWSIQSDSINLNSATATVTDGTMSRPVTVSALPENYGSTYAIRVLPNGWTSMAGHSYSVVVGGISGAINYTVDVVDCANIDGGECTAQDSGALGSDGGGAAGMTDAGSPESAGDATVVGDALVSGGAYDSGADGPPASIASGDGGSDDASFPGSPDAAGVAPASRSSGCSCSVLGDESRPTRFYVWTLVMATMTIAIRLRRRS